MHATSLPPVFRSLDALSDGILALRTLKTLICGALDGEADLRHSSEGISLLSNAHFDMIKEAQDAIAEALREELLAKPAREEAARAPRLESGEERRENRLAAIRSILRDIDYGAAAARFGLDGDMVRKLLYAMADAPQRELAATLNPDDGGFGMRRVQPVDMSRLFEPARTLRSELAEVDPASIAQAANVKQPLVERVLAALQAEIPDDPAPEKTGTDD